MPLTHAPVTTGAAAIANASITPAKLSFDPATQAELDAILPDIVLTPTGVAATDTANMDAAITLANSSKRRVYMMPGTYRRTTAWDCRGDGLTIETAGVLGVIIEQQTANTPILLVGRQFQRIGKMKLTYATAQAAANTNANAVVFYKSYLCNYEGFHISKCARGLHIAQEDYSISANDATGNYGLFSCRIGDVWIENYSVRAVNLRAYNRRATGSVLSNIYTVNEPGGVATTVDRVVEIELFDELVILQLNVEGVNTTASPILLNDARNVNITGLHFERVKVGGWASGFVDVFGSAVRALINAVTVCFSSMVPAASGGSDRVGFFKVGDGVALTVNGLSQHSNTTTSNERGLVVSDGVTSASVAILMTNALTAVTGREYIGGTAPQLPVVKQVGDDIYHLLEGGKNVTFGAAAPTTGTWAVGDKRYNTAPAAAGTPGWVCTTAGTPGTWKAMANLAA